MRIFFLFALVAVFYTHAAGGSVAGGCDSTRLPVVFVHGFLGSGDNWSLPIRRLVQNGYCANRLFVFDWNSVNRGRSTDSLLDVTINHVLRQTGAKAVNLVGHSAGGGLCYSYLADSIRARKVARYVHIGSSTMKAPAGPGGAVPTLNIYSKADQVVRNGGPIPGAENVQLYTADHLQVATGDSSLLAMFAFFNPGKQAKLPPFQAAGREGIRLAGKVVTLGENMPVSGNYRVVLYDPQSGTYRHTRGVPAWKPIGADGSWEVTQYADDYFSVEVKPDAGRRVIYFLENQPVDNLHLYLRTFPASGMVASLLQQLPSDSSKALLVVFSSNGALIAGRDSLLINGMPVTTTAIAPPSKTMIAAFVTDDGDGVSSYNPLPAFRSFPFLGSMDMVLKAGNYDPITIQLNNRIIRLPWEPSSNAVLIAVFD
ncbi:MAG TPA: alpha/beta fold hydrolase [Lacibacter sp.]|nr:alpha/beta fold hydrolase [Lacibacter sp.]HMO87882.1 alpha/beta fold hydrolase [Lacibacter sp.]HMP88400.1 alpha/beta fold hydrolase [Lacibacter sp.]